MENPYSWDTIRLLNEFMNACAKAGISHSGLVIDLSVGTELSRAHNLRGVVHARIDGVTPPVQPGDKVKPNKKTIAPSSSNGWERSRNERALPKILTVKTVHYVGNDCWEFMFQEVNDATADTESSYYEEGPRSWHVPLRFKAEDFTSVKEAPANVS